MDSSNVFTQQSESDELSSDQHKQDGKEGENSLRCPLRSPDHPQNENEQTEAYAKGGNDASQHMIDPGILLGIFYGHHIPNGFHHADGFLVSAQICANLADFQLGEISAPAIKISSAKNKNRKAFPAVDGSTYGLPVKAEVDLDIIRMIASKSSQNLAV